MISISRDGQAYLNALEVMPGLRYIKKIVKTQILEDQDELNYSIKSKRDWSGLLPEVPPRLFDYQQEVHDLVIKKFKCGSAALLSLPTGAGKTRTAVNIALTLLAKGVIKKVVWIAPSIELVDQAIGALRETWNQSARFHGLVYGSLGESNQHRVQFSFGTVQSAAKRHRELLFCKDTLLVFDEAHQAAARTYSNIISSARKKGSFALGLTATPGRSNENELNELVYLFASHLIIPSCLGNHPVTALRDRNVLSQLEIVNCLQSNSVGVSFVDNLQSFLEELRKRTSASGIGFAKSIEQAYLAAGAMSALGFLSEVISHDIPILKRQEKIHNLRAGKVQWLWNVELLSTGIDIPSLSSVALLTRIKSAILYEQILGRVSRGPAVGGSESSLVFDLCGNSAAFGDACSYSRFLKSDW